MTLGSCRGLQLGEGSKADGVHEEEEAAQGQGHDVYRGVVAPVLKYAVACLEACARACAACTAPTGHEQNAFTTGVLLKVPAPIP